MRDRDVREALRRKVLADHIRDPKTLIVEELGVLHGEARIDIAVVNGRLHGFEIKSDADTLQRLPNQISAYNSVFDRITIVAGLKHIEPILARVPLWWGIKQAKSGMRGAVHFEEVRAPLVNPDVQPIEVARLLWRAEALEVLASHGKTRIRSKTRQDLYSILAAEVPLKELRAAVRSALKSRAGWRSDAQRVPCGG